MGLERTTTLDCDKCGRELADNDGTVTGTDVYVMERANDCGWQYLDEQDGRFPGWYCSVCLAASAETERREP